MSNGMIMIMMIPLYIWIIFLLNSIKGCNVALETNNPSECLSQSVNGTFCCFIKPLEENSGGKARCYQTDVTKYLGNLQIHDNQITYSIDCGLGSTFMDSYWNLTVEDRIICGVEKPPNEKSCHDHSTATNTCCYYAGNGLTSCYWLGVKYQAKTTTGNGFTFSCKNTFLQIKGYFRMIYILMILFIKI